jgi:hypothetical protein
MTEANRAAEHTATGPHPIAEHAQTPSTTQSVAYEGEKTLKEHCEDAFQLLRLSQHGSFLKPNRAARAPSRRADGSTDYDTNYEMVQNAIRAKLATIRNLCQTEETDTLGDPNPVHQTRFATMFDDKVQIKQI